MLYLGVKTAERIQRAKESAGGWWVWETGWTICRIKLFRTGQQQARKLLRELW